MSDFLLSIDLDELNELLEDGGPKKGFIKPAIVKFVASGNVMDDMSELITWPKKKDKSVRTVAEQVTAVKATVKLKSVELGWPELVVVAGTLNGKTHESAIIVNKPLFDAAKAKDDADKAKAAKSAA